MVQVHPGPPFKPVNTRCFSLFPFSGLSLKKPFCQPFVNFTIGRMRLKELGFQPEVQRLSDSAIEMSPTRKAGRFPACIEVSSKRCETGSTPEGSWDAFSES